MKLFKSLLKFSFIFTLGFLSYYTIYVREQEPIFSIQAKLRRSVRNYIRPKFMKTDSSHWYNKGEKADFELQYPYDPEKLITINNISELDLKRAKMLQMVYGQESLPTKKLPSVKKKFIDNRYKDFEDIAYINKYTHEVKHGINSIAYHFIPYERNNKLIIYHQGHGLGGINGGDFIISKSKIEYFLNKGYEVIAMAMPLIGMNSQPLIYIDNLGYIKFNSHKKFSLLGKENGEPEYHPFIYFFEPITVFLNQVNHEKYESVSMTGISGGGWTTTLYAAFDPRIKYSFPVADGKPMTLNYRALGHWEDREHMFFSKFNYHDLYVMGSSGEGRAKIQIVNYFEHLHPGDIYKYYKKPIQDRVKKIGLGLFDVFDDRSHATHEVSDKALEYIHSFIKNQDFK